MVCCADEMLVEGTVTELSHALAARSRTAVAGVIDSPWLAGPADDSQRLDMSTKTTAFSFSPTQFPDPYDIFCVQWTCRAELRPARGVLRGKTATLSIGGVLRPGWFLLLGSPERHTLCWAAESSPESTSSKVSGLGLPGVGDFS